MQMLAMPTLVLGFGWAFAVGCGRSHGINLGWHHWLPGTVGRFLPCMVPVRQVPGFGWGSAPASESHVMY